MKHPFPTPQNETPATLAGVTGADHSEVEQGRRYFVKLAETIPLRHARAACAVLGALDDLRRGHDRAELIAGVLAQALGERELTLIADAAALAMHERMRPSL